MIEKITFLKYEDPRSPLVVVTIENTFISNVLMDLGASINVMAYETMMNIWCIEVIPISIVLQLKYRYTIISYGIIEDVLVVVDSY